MALITLYGKGNQVMDELPSLCIRCGAPAKVTKGKYFYWCPSWVYFLLILNLLVCVVVAMLVRKNMNVPLPLCRKHKYPWFWQQMAALGLVGVIIVGVVILIVLNDNRNSEAVKTAAGIAFGLAFLGMLITLVVVQWNSLRATKITERSITLSGVSPIFVDKMEEEDERLDDDDGDSDYDLPPPSPRNRIRSNRDDDRFTD